MTSVMLEEKWKRKKIYITCLHFMLFKWLRSLYIRKETRTSTAVNICLEAMYRDSARIHPPFSNTLGTNFLHKMMRYSNLTSYIHVRIYILIIISWRCIIKGKPPQRVICGTVTFLVACVFLDHTLGDHTILSEEIFIKHSMFCL